MSKLIIFTHIQKTAGTTLGRTLKAKYGFWPLANLSRLDLALGLHSYHLNGDFPLERINAIKRLSDTDRSKIKLLQGHMSYGVHMHFCQPHQYITALRDPVSRVLSHYHQMKNQAWCPYRDQMQQLSIDKFLELNPIDGLSNYQTKLLAGSYQAVPGNAVPYYRTESNEALLDLAIDNLNQNYLFVLTELFDESLLLMGDILGWGNTYYTKSNVTRKRKHRAEYSERMLDVVRAHNTQDIALYERARAILSERIDAQGPSFKERLSQFKARNAVVNRWLSPTLDAAFKAGKRANAAIQRGL